MTDKGQALLFEEAGRQAGINGAAYVRGFIKGFAGELGNPKVEERVRIDQISERMIPEAYKKAVDDVQYGN